MEGSKMARRESARRRSLWLAIAALAVLSLSPLFSHHLLPASNGETSGPGHLVALCLVALQILLRPLHEFFHLLFAAGVAYAVYDRLKAWRLAHNGIALLNIQHLEPGDIVYSAARIADMDPTRISVAEGLPGAALTIGWWKPAILISRDTVERLSEPQLVAVLLHERAHLRRRDPLRLSLLRFVACMLFWVPAIRRLADDVADEAEIVADDEAARGKPLILASALLEVAMFTGGRPFTQHGVGFNGRPLLERRVRRLLGEDAGPTSHLTWRSAVVAAFTLVLVLGSGAIVGHSVSAQEEPHLAEHCGDHEMPVTSHLFCLFDGNDHGAEDCPHRVYSGVTHP